MITTTNTMVYPWVGDWDEDEYERDLRRRQTEHLRNVRQQFSRPHMPCMHDACPECIGTGVKRDGSPCVHGISCPCPKCTPWC